MGENTSLLGKVVTWTIIGIGAILALKIAVSLLGMVFGLTVFLLFTVGPILLLGWLAMKAWKAFARESTI